jgi:hypothetical protein
MKGALLEVGSTSALAAPAWLWLVQLGASPEVGAIGAALVALFLNVGGRLAWRFAARWRPSLRRWGLDVTPDGDGVRVVSLDVLAHRLRIHPETLDLLIDEGDDLTIDEVAELLGLAGRTWTDLDAPPSQTGGLKL